MKEISKPKKKKKPERAIIGSSGQLCIADDLCICFCLYSDGIWNYRCIRIPKGILGSEWVGLKYFKQFFNTISRKIIFNTLYLGIYSLIAGFPIPILLTILLNEMRKQSIRNLSKWLYAILYFYRCYGWYDDAYDGYAYWYHQPRLQSIGIGLLTSLVKLICSHHFMYGVVSGGCWLFFYYLYSSTCRCKP